MALPNKVFVDTSFFIALLNSRDADHAAALSLQKALVGVRKLTSEYILLELCDGLAKLRYRDLAIRTVELLQQLIIPLSLPALDIWGMRKYTS